MKKSAFVIIFIILSFLFMDLSGQAAYRLIKKRFTWQAYEQYGFGVFNIRMFSEFVDDDRLVTLKKNFTGKQDYWRVDTDANRFRIGVNRYFNDRENFVFLGDSVPFGWGVDADKNVPSKFYELIAGRLGSRYGVINAAIPSYSLYQAVKRYQLEIDGKFPVKYVILQIYDPATNFACLGRKWDKKACWTSKNTLASFKSMLKAHGRLERFMYKYSFTYHSLYSFAAKRKASQSPLPALLDLNDKEAFDFFEKENYAVLEELNSLLSKRNVVFIILPVNTIKSIHDFKGQELLSLSLSAKATLAATDKLNQVLKKFALSHKNVYYFDITGYFDKSDKKRLFIDNCHLSEEGARKQAEFIMEQLEINNLF